MIVAPRFAAVQGPTGISVPPPKPSANRAWVAQPHARGPSGTSTCFTRFFRLNSPLEFLTPFARRNTMAAGRGRIFDDITQCIGNTPLIKLRRVVGDAKATVVAKM